MFLAIAFLLCVGLASPVLGQCSGGRTKKEVRGAWIATVSNIDWPKSSTASTSKNQADLRALLDSLQNAGINFIVFQVRPAGDAFYKSSIEPWSRWLTGSQGQAPSPLWDPLDFVIQECHKRNMELHAWFNPYRANVGSTSTSGLASNNMAKAFPSDAHVYGNYVWMDPSSGQVQDRVNDVIMDVVNRYDVDGIHMDDYFYPYPTSQAFPDSANYQAYRNNGGSMSQADWRRNNVDKLIQRLSTNIHAAKPYVKFGISPFGIWKSGTPSGIVGSSSYNDLYADPRKWLQQGWLDYLAPQLYWQIDPPAQSFTALLDWWSADAQNPKDRHVYPGLADYKLTDNNWVTYEIIHQIMISQIRQSHQVFGAIHFSANDIEGNTKGLTDSLKSDVYQTPALLPSMSWLSGVSSPSKPQVTAGSSTLNWGSSSKTSVRSWGVYKVSGTTCTLVKVLSADQTSTSVSDGTYVVSAVDRIGREVDSASVNVDSTIVG